MNESTASGHVTRPGIFELSDQYIIESAALDPMLASFWGIPGHDEEITDYSPQGWAARLELQQRTILEPCRRSNHDDRSERIATEVMRERVQAELDLIESGEYHRWLCVLNSHHEYVREIFDFMPRQSDEDWTNVRRRLAAVPQALDRLRASFLYAADKGQVAARRQALACAAQCEVWGGPDGYFGELAAECASLDLTAEAAAAAEAFTEFGRWLRARLRGDRDSPRSGRAPSGTGCSSATTTAPTSTSTRPTNGAGTSCTASSSAWPRWSSGYFRGLLATSASIG